MLELLAEELRRARTGAGMSQEVLAKELNYSASLVAMVEQCRRVPRQEFTRRCDDALGTGGILSRIREKLRREALLPWFREWAAAEQQAVALRWYEPLVVPGLLQTEAYARALLTGAGRFRFTADEIEQHVASRLERQEVLHRENPPHFVAVLDEYALRRAIGGPAVMRAQAQHLLELGARPRVHLHVVPGTAGAYPGLNGAFVLATLDGGEDLAYLDNQLQGQIADRPADVQSLRDTWEAVRAEALPHQRSVELIEEVAKSWS